MYSTPVLTRVWELADGPTSSRVWELAKSETRLAHNPLHVFPALVYPSPHQNYCPPHNNYNTAARLLSIASHHAVDLTSMRRRAAPQCNSKQCQMA